MQNLISERNMELLSYVALVSYIAFHPEIPSQLKPIVSHPITKFLVAFSIVYLARENTTIAILLALVYVSTYLSCITTSEGFGAPKKDCKKECNKKQTRKEYRECIDRCEK